LIKIKIDVNYLFILPVYKGFSNSSGSLGYYLAGLIDGDGSFYIPKNNRDKNGKLRNPIIKIVFAMKDVYLAKYLIKTLGGGTLLNPKGNYVELLIQDKKTLYI
jgi:hypothetical protein